VVKSWFIGLTTPGFVGAGALLLLQPTKLVNKLSTKKQDNFFIVLFLIEPLPQVA
jgi:hypothetical protein